MNRPVVKGLMAKRWVWVVALAVGLCAAYGTASAITWSSYDKTVADWQQESKQSAEAVLLKPDAGTDNEKKIDALGALGSDMIKRADSACAVNMLVAWQAAVSVLGEKKQACEQAARAVRDFGEKTRGFAEYQKTARAYQESLAPLLDSKELDEKDWSARSSAWQRHLDDLSKQAPGEAFKPVHDVAVSKEESIVSAWKQLLKAHKSKDEQAYTKAKAALNDAYGALSSVAKASEVQARILAAEVAQAYDTAF